MSAHATDTKTATNDAETRSAPSAAGPDVRGIVARSGGDVQAVAALIQSNPSAQQAILMWLQQTFGLAAVRSVVEFLTGPAEPSAASAQGPMRVKVDGLNVRSTPGKAADNIVGMLHRNAVVDASGHDGEWTKIEYHGQPAFVFSQYVEPAKPRAHAKPHAPTTPTGGTGDHAAAHDPAPHAHEPSAAHPIPEAHLPAAHAPPAPHAPVATTTSSTTATTATATTNAHHDAPPPPVAYHDAPPPPAAHSTDHVATPAQVAEPKPAADKAKDDAKHKKPPPSGYSKSGGGSTKAVLTRLANAGKLKITPNQIAQFDGASQIESGGQIASVDTTDDEVVSIGFFQLVLGDKSIEAVMKKVPGAFAKYGLELDLTKTYGFKSRPHQIKGCDDYHELRGHDWGDKFYAASADDEIIVACAEFVIAESKQVEQITTSHGGTNSLFADDTARAWLLELHNNRPAYVAGTVDRAVAAGAPHAKDREKFLDILAAAIVDAYNPEGVAMYHHAKSLKQNQHLTPEQDAALLAEMTAKARLKGTHIVQQISRHLVLPTLDPVAAAPAHDGAAAGHGAATPAPDTHATTPPTAHATAPTGDPHKVGEHKPETTHATTTTPPQVTTEPPPQATAGGRDPVVTWTPPADANLSDETLARMAADLHDANADKVLKDLAGVVAVAAKLKKHLYNNAEAQGPDRENLVSGIGVVRGDLQKLTGHEPKVEAFKVAVNHKLEALSPYYAQVNIRTIETGTYTTCNVTSLAMSLSTIGKNADAYKESKRPHLEAVARHYIGDVKKAERTSSGNDAVWASLRGMRLPDFMELAAIATNIHSANPTDGEIKAAAQTACNDKIQLPFLAQIAHDFDAKTEYSSATLGDQTDALKSIGHAHHGETDDLVDARNAAERNPNNAALRAKYEKRKAEVDPHINNKAIEKQLPLQQYKDGVLKKIRPLIDSGAGVIASTYNHFTHCYAINDEFIMVQDPGLWARADRKIMWDEARALEYFWNYLVVK